MKNKSTHQVISPTVKQVTNAHSMGWQYIGDGYFARGDDIGGFVDGRGWVIF